MISTLLLTLIAISTAQVFCNLFPATHARYRRWVSATGVKAKALWYLLRAKRYALFTDDEPNAGNPHCTTNKFRVGSAQTAARFLDRTSDTALDLYDADRALAAVKQSLQQTKQ